MRFAALIFILVGCIPGKDSVTTIRDTLLIFRHDTVYLEAPAPPAMPDSGKYNLFPTGFDNSREIQDMWDAGIQVRPAPGAYYIDHPVYGWRRNSSGGFAQFSGSIVGPYNAKNSPNFMNAVFYVRNRDSSAFYVQHGKGVLFQNIAIRGSYLLPGSIDPYRMQTMRYSDWSDGGADLYAAIAVDGFNDPTGSRSGSTGVDVIGCSIRYFCQGISYECGSNIQNGDECNVLDCEIDYCKVCLDYGQDQTKGNYVERLKVWGGVHTVFGTNFHGIGTLPYINIVSIAGGVYQIFYAPTGGRFTAEANGIYAEMVFKIGVIGGVPMPSITNSTFDFMDFGFAPDYYIYGQAVLEHCQTRIYNGSINKINLSGFRGFINYGSIEQPITESVCNGGTGFGVPTFQKVSACDVTNGFYDGVLPKVTSYLRQDSIHVSGYSAKISAAGLSIGDYLLAGEEGTKYYDDGQFLPKGYNLPTVQLGRVVSISNGIATLDQVSISAVSGRLYQIYKK